MQNAKYSRGQVWSYRARPSEEKSRLYIVRVDTNQKLDNIYHIFVDNLSLKNPHAETGIQDVLPHAPVSGKTLDASVIDLIETRDTNLPNISEGYKIWREAFDKGEGGVFTIPVAEIIQYIEDIVNGKTDG